MSEAQGAATGTVAPRCRWLIEQGCLGLPHAESGALDVRVSCLRIFAFALVLPLATSGARSQTDPSPGYATQPFTPKNFHLPEGSGCSGDVARWQAIQDNDYRSGNIGLPVYHRIQSEIEQAAAACSGGRDAQASAMIRASRARHGYPQ